MTIEDGVQPLTNADRHLVYSLLGLHRFSFGYQEVAGTQALRAWVVGPRGSVPLFPSESLPTELPILTRNHMAYQLAERGAFPGHDLWAEVFPFPFSEVAREVDSSDVQWKQASLELVRAFALLEQRLFQREISLLHLSHGSDVLALFFHCVRKRFQVVGKVALPGGMEEQTGSTDSRGSLKRLGAGFQSLSLQFSAAHSFETQCLAVISEIQRVLDRPPLSQGISLEQNPNPLPSPLPL